MQISAYQSAHNGALDRLRGLGFEMTGTHFAAHAPMVAEAMAALDLGAQVPDWLEYNLSIRSYQPEPAPGSRLDPTDQAEWRQALGAQHRVADWVRLFDEEISDHGWQAALAAWWPRLLPGMGTSLTHGLIRTAHAVRGVGRTDRPSPLQLHELANGLGYWASCYRPDPEPANVRAAGDPVPVRELLSDLIAGNAGIYSTARIGFPVPLIHAITAPAAVGLVLPHLPVEMHLPSYETAARVSRTLVATFAKGGSPDAGMVGDAPSPEQIVADAVELGDEHAIKLAEAAVREHALRPDPRLLTASAVATRRITAAPR
jgi:hypothetical protein